MEHKKYKIMRIIFILTLISVQGFGQCVIDGTTLVGPGTKTTHAKACSLTVTGINGIPKFNGTSAATLAVAGSDYSTPSSLSDSLEKYLPLSAGGSADMTGTIYGGGSASIDPVSKDLYNLSGTGITISYGVSTLFDSGLPIVGWADANLNGLQLSSLGAAYTAYIKNSNLTGNVTLQIPPTSGVIQNENNTATLTNKTWNGSTIGVAYGGTGITSFGSGVATWLGTPSSANLAAAVTDETGTGSAVFSASPTLTGTITLGKPYITDRIVLPSTSSSIYIYNTSDTTTNYERARLYFTSNVFRIGSEAGGSGTARAVQFVGPNGTFTARSASVVGSLSLNSGQTSGGNSTFGIIGSVTNSSSVVNGISYIQTINQSSTAGYRALWIAPYEQATGSGVKRLITAGTNSDADGGGSYTERFYVDNAGNTVAAKYSLSALNTAPSSAGDTGTTGEIRIDADYIYICTATNTWKRVAISTW